MYKYLGMKYGLGLVYIPCFWTGQCRKGRVIDLERVVFHHSIGRVWPVNDRSFTVYSHDGLRVDDE